MKSELELEARDQVAIPINWFHAETAPRACMLLLPALGIRASLYDGFAQQLAESGVSVCVMEQRGHGRSALRPTQGADFGIDDILDCDVPVLLEWLQEQAPNVPLILAGHSLGGHLATIACGQHLARVAAVLHLATAFPYVKDYPRRKALQVALLTRLIGPLTRVLGYYPGKRLGFGGEEASTLMRQWCQWARSGSFDVGRYREVTAATARFSGPVLSIAFERDDLVSERAIARALSPFSGASVERRTLGEREQGRFLGHSGWAKQPGGVVRTVTDWLESIHVSPIQ